MKRLLSAILLASLLLASVSMVKAWELDRPHSTLEFHKQMEENATSNDEASVGLGVHIEEYDEQTETKLYDSVGLRIIATANTRTNVDYAITDVSYDYSWFEITDPIGNISLDNPQEIFDVEWYSDFPLPIRFYGGPGRDIGVAGYVPGSGEYSILNGINGSINGFLGFNYKPYKYQLQKPYGKV